MLTRTRKIYVGAVVIYLLVIIGQMAYAIYDNALISENNAFAFEYLFNTVQPFGVDETMIGAIAIFYLFQSWVLHWQSISKIITNYTMLLVEQDGITF